MGFQEKFFGVNKLQTDNFQALSSFGSQSTLIGWKADQTSFNKLQKLVQKTFQQSIERVVHRQITATSDLLKELAKQENELNYLINHFSQIPSHENLADRCQQLTDYLGIEFSKIRWVMEPYTITSKQSFQNLLESLNESVQQKFREGIKCFEIGEYSFAKEQINNSLSGNRTNYFAYQYLGFIAVLENDPETALANFKLSRKFADNDYQHALALSHLAIGCYAIDETEKAIELTKRATEKYPSLARFWYQLAKYYSLLENKEKTLSALEKAIKCDWTFWGVIIVDTHFDYLRLEINQLLVNLRQYQKEMVLDSVENLKKAIATVKQVGASHNLSKTNIVSLDLEEQCSNNTIFNYLELLSQSQERYINVFQIGEKYTKERISEKHSFLTQQDTNKNRSIKELETPINALIQEKKELKLLHTNWNIGCAGYILLNMFCFALFISLTLFIAPSYLLVFPSNQLKPASIIIVGILSAFAALSLPITFNKISYTNKVTAREKKIEKEIQNKKKASRQLKTKIEEDYKVTKTKAEEELKQLESYLAICQNRQYL